MSDWTIAAIWIGSVLAYCVVAGVAHTIMRARWGAGEEPGPALGAIFWPLALPTLLSKMATEKAIAWREAREEAKKEAAKKAAAAYKSPPDPKDYRGTEVK